MLPKYYSKTSSVCKYWHRMTALCLDFVTADNPPRLVLLISARFGANSRLMWGCVEFMASEHVVPVQLGPLQSHGDDDGFGAKVLADR